MKKLIISMLFLTIMQVSVAAEAVNHTLPKKVMNNTKIYNEENKNVVVTAKDSTFTINLKSNPTTGYSWFLREYDANFVTPVSHHFSKPKQDLVGAPGVETFVFRIKPDAFIVPMQTSIRLKYTRPFQGEDESKQIIFYVTAQ